MGPTETFLFVALLRGRTRRLLAYLAVGEGLFLALFSEEYFILFILFVLVFFFRFCSY